MSELQRVLAALESGRMYAGRHSPETVTKKQVARVIRELAADFELRSRDSHTAKCNTDSNSRADCTCGLDAAREKWRLEP